MLPLIKSVGLNGVELAPTSIWPDIRNVDELEVKNLRRMIESSNLEVSGIQSLLFGFPELQLFSKETWPELIAHLEHMFMIADNLGAGVAVFGSPRNRKKGNLTWDQALEVSHEFFSSLIPSLERHNLVLTLEPNAPGYGSDFLLNYQDVVDLSIAINSPRISTQIDTGCLWMVGDDPSVAYNLQVPHHIHLSVPNLKPVPGAFDFSSFLQLLQERDYPGWLVIEALGDSAEVALSAARWFRSELEA